RPGAALALAGRATEVAPERSANFVTLGFVASAAGDKRLAREAYERAVALDPADSAAWNNLGCLDLEAGRPLLAKARFREALRLDPRGARARRNLGLLVGSPESGVARQVRGWDDGVEEPARELKRGRARRLTLAALVLEAPPAARALVTRNLAVSGAATAVALRALGPAAALPIAVGAAMAGAAWLYHRRALAERRAEVRQVLSDGRQRF